MNSQKLDLGSLVREGTFERQEVIEIVTTVLEKLHIDPAGHLDVLNNIKELRDIIQNARNEISVSNIGDIKSKHIPVATDELDAVVDSTAEATGQIMDACEVIQSDLGSIDAELSTKINNEVIKIFEACSFQDITGQRITKVVSALKEIEGKIVSLLGDGDLDGYVADDVDERSEDEKLLNGPQLDGQGVSQSDIDKILSGSE